MKCRKDGCASLNTPNSATDHRGSALKTRHPTNNTAIIVIIVIIIIATITMAIVARYCIVEWSKHTVNEERGTRKYECLPCPPKPNRITPKAVPSEGKVALGSGVCGSCGASEAHKPMITPTRMTVARIAMTAVPHTFFTRTRTQREVELRQFKKQQATE